MKKLVIGVDGTAGSGKSATFKKVAQILGYEFIDTGLMYRAFTLLGIWKKIDFTVQNQILTLIPEFDYQVKNQRIYLNQKDVTWQLQETKIIQLINYITVVGQVRKMMVEKQQKMVQTGGVVMVGRDITSVVLPKADLKIYLDSSVETRALRRYQQNLEQGINDVDLNQIKQAILDRDQVDQNRQVGALKKVKGAWVIDNSNLTIDQTVAMVVKKVREMEQQLDGK